MKSAPLVLLLLAAGACGRRSPPVPRLETAMRELRTAPPCRAVVPIEWAASWPVPLDGARLRVLFYPLEYRQNAPQLYSPGAQADLDARTGAVVSCVRQDAPPALRSSRRWPAGAPRALKDFIAASDGLLAETESVAEAFGGRRLDAPARDAARRYLTAFEALAEPDLLPFYYRASPAFWEWVRAAAGRSIPRA